MRRILPGFITPPVIIVLAIITFGVALSLFANSILFNKKNQPAPTNQIPPDVITESQDETANWKTYTNTDYGYSFNYPEGVNLIEKKGLEGKGFDYFEGEVVDVVSFEYPNVGEQSLVIGIEVIKGVKMSTREYAKKSQEYDDSSTGYQSTFEEIPINGKEGYKYTDSVAHGSVVIVGAKNPGTIIQISSIIRNLEKANEHSSIFNQMLSTFQFLN